MMVFSFDNSPTLIRSHAFIGFSLVAVIERGPTLDADQCINVVRYRCCRLQAAVEFLLAVFLLPFVDHHALYSSFRNLNPARLAEF
jgi:hypothetical protein